MNRESPSEEQKRTSMNCDHTGDNQTASVDAEKKQGEPDHRLLTDGGRDNAKVVGHNDDSDGETVGVWGEVDSADGYGLATDDDAKIAGNLAAGDEFHVALDNQFTTEELDASLSIFEPETVESPSYGADIDASGSVLAGQLNSIWGGAVGAVVAGGGRDHEAEQSEENTVRSHWGTISGGVGNRVGDTQEQWDLAFGTVGGGQGNDVQGEHSTIAGGKDNVIEDDRATIAGGHGNGVTETHGAVAGGISNIVSGSAGVISGGRNNEATGEYATIGGGGSDDFDGGNVASDAFATVGGGEQNEASAANATVGGGEDNKASGESATVGGGKENEANAANATVGGGEDNKASGESATVGGGENNDASGGATVGGGNWNRAEGVFATVGGGGLNEASGNYSTVPGGRSNEALEKYSFAAGRNATADHSGAVVVGDGSTNGVSSDGTDQFVVQAGGGAKIYSDSDTTETPNGVELPSNEGSWESLSASEVKSNVSPVQHRAVLEGVNALDISTWHYNGNEEIEHMGPMAEQFYEQFGLGSDERRISTVDADGVALAAIQGLSEQLEDKEKRIADLEEKTDRIEELEARNEELEDRLAALEAKTEATE